MKVIGLILIACAVTNAKEWWQSASLYQIYPRSFKDSDGNGVGDIKGITHNLEYIKDLGIDCIWLSPILKSPQADFGYDISDFRDIDPLFGTMEDFDALLNKTKQLGVKILMDFVPNHTSDEHQWFIESENGNATFKDYYMWVNGVNCKEEPWVEEEGVPCNYPNNWVSVFYGHAWTWSWKRKQFYLHQFDKKQPDLNYRNKAVAQEMKDILTFWLDKGVDGFRIDAINFLIENEDLKDEELTGWTEDSESWDYIYHHNTIDLDETYEFVYDWRVLIDKYNTDHGGDPRVLITETYANISRVMKYYQSDDGKRQGSNFPFNFGFIGGIHGESNAKDFKHVISEWMDNMPEGGTANWVLGNHDQKRFGTRFGPERIIPMHSIILTLPGVSVTYYGDEIGMVNHDGITWEETKDPQACNGPEEGYNERSRDPARTPFQWNASEYAGFSEIIDKKPWLPVHPDYVKNNLDLQAKDDSSIYRYFRNLIALRKQPAFVEGSFHIETLSDSTFAYTRRHDDRTYVILANVGKTTEKISLGETFNDFPPEVEVELPGIKSEYKKGSKVSISSIDVPGHDTLIFTYKSGAVQLVATMCMLLCMAVVFILF